MAGPSLASLALDEIVERHRFFERWFNGEADMPDFATSLRRFDAGFRRVDPAGKETDRAALEASLGSLRGSRRAGPVRIGIEAPQILWQGADAVLAAYVEVQSFAGAPGPTRRRSTALFIASPDAGAPLWRHVQETAIAPIHQPGGVQDPAITPGDGT